MMSTFRTWGRLPDLAAVFRRFPVAMALVAVMTLIFMVEGGSAGNGVAWKVVGGCILGAYVCVGLQLASESRGRVGQWIWPAKMAAAAVAIVLCVFWQALAFQVGVAIAAAIVFLGNWAFLRRERQDGQVWLFTQKLWTGAIFATVGSIIYVLGVLAISETLKTLFALDLGTVAEHFILPLGLAFLAPAYWMGTLPDPRADAEGLGELSFEARALAFVGAWLLAPLTLIYGVIVLAYAVRIVVTMELPKGEVATIVTPFLAVGTLTWLMLEPQVLKAGGPTRLFRRLWFPMMLAAGLLLMVSIGVRVGEYGLTPERVGLLLYAVASLVIAGWFTLRLDSDIRIPTAVATGFLVLGAFGAKPIADLDQLRRLDVGIEADDGTAVHSAAAYLASQDRMDWLEARFPDGPSGNTFLTAEWREHLNALGYDDRGYREARAWEEAFQRVSFSSVGEIDLSATPRLVGGFWVQVLRIEDETMRDPREGIWKNAVLQIYLDSQRLELPAPFDFQGALERASVDRSSQDLPAVVIASRMPDGRKATLVFTELTLNGARGTLSGGYGELLLFTE